MRASITNIVIAPCVVEGKRGSRSSPLKVLNIVFGTSGLGRLVPAPA